MFSEKRQTDILFRQLVEKDRSYDPQLAVLKEQMAEAEDQINSSEEFIDGTHESPLFSELCEAWEFDNSLARVSGKVYIDDEDYVQVVAEHWGPVRYDERGAWFDLHSTEFVSVGLYVSVINDDKEEMYKDARVGYCFVLPEDADAPEDEVVSFFTLPEDVFVEFLRPSTAAVDYRLHEAEPAMTAAIDGALPAGSANMTRKIVKLSEVFKQHQLQEENIEYLAQYVMSKLESDRQWPYVLRISQSMVFGDGDGEPEQIALEQPIEICAYIRSISLVYSCETQTVNATLDLSLPANRESENEIEGVLHVPFDSIDHIGSLRPQKTLRQQVAAAIIQKVNLPAPMISTDAVAAIKMPEEQKTQYIHRETVYERLARQNDALDEAIALAEEAREQKYYSVEDASKDGVALLGELRGIFADNSLYGARLSAEGATVLRPNMSISQGDSAASLNFSREPMFVQGEPFNQYVGAVAEIYLRLKKNGEDGDDSLHYILDPYVLLQDKQPDLLSMSTPEGANAVSAMAYSTTYTPLGDGASSIKYPEYQALRKRAMVLEEYSHQEGSEKTLRLLHDLNRAFYHITDQAFTSLQHVERLREVAARIEASNDEAGREALEALFTSGQLLTLGGVEATSTGHESATISGYFAGIVTDHPYTDHLEPTFVIEAQNGLRYMPISSIQTLSF